MGLRVATFNVENLMNRFDFSGFRNQLYQDRALSLYNIKNEAHYQALEQARAISHTDDTRQLTALAISYCAADIVCLQEVDNLEALNAFEFGYLYRMTGQGYRQKKLVSGNDGRGIDVAVMMREHTQDGQPIELVEATSHAHLTFDELGLMNPELAELGIEGGDRIFRRDCLEVDVKIGGRPLTLYIAHFKSMGGYRDGRPGREVTMPVREAEAEAVRHVIENRFGKTRAGKMNWLICGDLNAYSERMIVSGTPRDGFMFEYTKEEESSLKVFYRDGFANNLVARRPKDDRWTLYHSRGPREQHLCQLDYLLASPALAEKNADAVPEIVRGGQPWRTPFPAAQHVELFPRSGWDRPKASDHCPVVVELNAL